MKPLSAEMAACMVETIEHGGKLIRHTGNRWSWPGCPRADGGLPVTHYRTGTVDGLVARGEMRFIKHRRGRGRERVPVAAEVVGKFGREASA